MFYLMKKTTGTKTTSKFLDAYLKVRRVKPNRLILSAHDRVLNEGALARYNMTRVDLKIYIFGQVEIPVY